MAKTADQVSIISVTDANNDLDTTGLCLLSLDGGGVRGLSSLYILKGLMTRLNYERQAVGLPQVKPCEIFDLIGGTSTGGLIAIMLGRLEMDIDECIQAYKTTMKTVFEKKRNVLSLSFSGKVKAKFSSKALEVAIRQVIKEREGFDEDDLLYDQSASSDSIRKCRVFVCAKSQENNQIARLRSYRLPGGFDDNPKIWEAALATSAAPSFFDPVKIGVRKYVDGAIGANNPISQVEDEAANIWCEETGRLEPIVKCFISIGTGHADLTAIKDKSLKALAQSIVKVATETRETNERFAGRWRAHLDTRFFRFNVEDGLQNVGLAEYNEEAIIDAGTRLYLDGHSLKRKVRVCVQNLRQKRYKPNHDFVLERAKSQERKEKEEREGRKGREQGQPQSTATEISELIERGTATLRRAAERPTKEDLLKAQDDFTRAFRGMASQASQPKAKDFAKIHQKLAITSLRLSHLSNTFSEQERMNHVREAQKHAASALEYAVRSQNDGRVAQMRFHVACVQAREVCLLLESNADARADDTLRSKREGALGAITVALSELECLEGMDMAAYDSMARQYSKALLLGARA